MRGVQIFLCLLFLEKEESMHISIANQSSGPEASSPEAISSSYIAVRQDTSPSLYLPLGLLYCTRVTWESLMYFAYYEGWKEYKLFSAPDLLMKN